MEKTDIISRKDVMRLVDSFYDKVKCDPMLGGVFGHVRWEDHLPMMYNFWSSMLFGDQSYRGNPLRPHLNLPVSTGHFRQWLKLFDETVDENFAGANAEEIKVRAWAIAGVFQHKMGLPDAPATLKYDC
jgi:hemoglobin